MSYIIVFLLTSLILIAVVYILINGNKVSSVKCVIAVTVIILVWITYTGLISENLFNSDHKWKTVFLILPLFMLVIYALISRAVFNVIKLIPPEYLIYIQSYRIFTELYFWLMYMNDLVSPRITINGLNYDMFIGLSAPIVGYYTLAQNKWPHLVAVFWNIAGILLVINIMLLSFSSANNILFKFPHILVIGFIVPFGLIVNLMSLKVIVFRELIN